MSAEKTDRGGLWIARLIAFVAACLAIRPAPGGAQTIHFFQRGYVAGGTAKATVLTDQALAGFARRHPEIKVETVGLPWSREGDLKLRAVLLNRQKIDVFRVTNDQLPAFIPAKGDLLSPIDDRLTEDDLKDIAPSALDALRHKGKVMAWPLWSTALSLLGNPEIMRERGIEPPGERPWNWEEFLAALRKGTFVNAKGERVFGMTSAARPPLFEWSPLIWAQAGPAFLPPAREGELGLAPGLPAALEKIAALRREGLVPESFGIDDQPAAQRQFIEGRAAFILCSPAFIGVFAAKQAPYVILPPPTGDYGKPITTGALGAFAVVAHPDDPERERAAHLFARYLTSAEVVEDAPQWYLAPPVRASIKSFQDDPVFKGLAPIVRTAVYMNPPGGSGFFESVIIPQLQSAMMGLTPPDAAIKEIEAAHERGRLR